VFSPKSEISINGYTALVTTVIGDSIIVKFKEESATLNAGSIQKADGSLIICKKNGAVFLDVANSDPGIYDDLSQNIDDIRVRIGDLSLINGYSGLGAIFNGNIAVKNGPFTLNSDGSGNIGSELI
jgi:hypothetical protein